jgi:hypothetical protein
MRARCWCRWSSARSRDGRDRLPGLRRRTGGPTSWLRFGDRKWGGKFNAKEAEERGGVAMVNDTRRAINHMKRILGRTGLPAGTRLRFDSSLPWPDANELLASTFVLTDDLTPHHPRGQAAHRTGDRVMEPEELSERECQQLRTLYSLHSTRPSPHETISDLTARAGARGRPATWYHETISDLKRRGAGWCLARTTRGCRARSPVGHVDRAGPRAGPYALIHVRHGPEPPEARDRLRRLELGARPTGPARACPDGRRSPLTSMCPN